MAQLQTLAFITGTRADGTAEVLAVGDAGEVRAMWEEAIYLDEYAEVAYWDRATMRDHTYHRETPTKNTKLPPLQTIVDKKRR